MNTLKTILKIENPCVASYGRQAGQATKRAAPNLNLSATAGYRLFDFLVQHPDLGFVLEREGKQPATSKVYHLTLQASGQTYQDIYWPFGTSDFIKGPDADPDGDGIVNVMEYALDLDPNTSDTSGLPVFLFVTDTGAEYGALSYTHVKAATDLDYTVVASSDLRSRIWTPLTTVVSTVDQGATEIVTVRDSVLASSTPVRFYQLRVQPH